MAGAPHALSGLMLAAFRRYWALTRKEFHQLQRNPKLIVQLTIPPTIMLVLWGYALSPDVRDLDLAIVDLDRSAASRSLIAAVEELSAFRVRARYISEADLEAGFDRRAIGAALVIPPGFSRDLSRARRVEVQLILDAVVANSAAVAGGYVKQVVADYNRRLLESGRVALRTAARPSAGGADVRTIALFNPGMQFSWYYVTAVMGVVLFVDGSLIAAAIAVREKETGTIEQLLMSPAQSLEILLAKTTPVLVLLQVGLIASTVTAHFVFDLPQRGPWLLFLVAGVLAGLAAMGLGILLATYSENQQQAQLLTFFVNPFIMLFSGAFSRIENMPLVCQWASWLDPLRYLVEVIRGVTIKGAGIELLWKPLLALAAVSAALYCLSAWRYRKQH